MAFVQGWLLALVLMCFIPPMAISAAAMSIVIQKMATLGQSAYSEAGIVVEQTISSIRTVWLRVINVSISSMHILNSYYS